MTKIQQINEYFAHPALSQSKLKLLLNSGVAAFKNIEEDNIIEEKDAKLIGSIVDDLFTFDEVEFNTKYHIGEFNCKPSATILNILDPVITTNINNQPILNFKELLIESAINQNYGNNTFKKDRIWNDILKAESYWNEVSKTIGKTVISQEEYQLSTRIQNNIITHEYTNSYFNDSCIYQIPLFFNIDGTPCKALIDKICKINNDLIVQDIKITANNRRFGSMIERFRYDIQNSFYMKAINSNLDILTESFGQLDNIKFSFLVGSYKYQTSPLVYTISNLDIAEEDIKNGIELYNWHVNNGIWDEDKDIYLNKGHIVI